MAEGSEDSDTSDDGESIAPLPPQPVSCLSGSGSATPGAPLATPECCNGTERAEPSPLQIHQVVAMHVMRMQTDLVQELESLLATLSAECERRRQPPDRDQQAEPPAKAVHAAPTPPLCKAGGKDYQAAKSKLQGGACDTVCEKAETGAPASAIKQSCPKADWKGNARRPTVFATSIAREHGGTMDKTKSSDEEQTMVIATPLAPISSQAEPPARDSVLNRMNSDLTFGGDRPAKEPKVKIAADPTYESSENGFDVAEILPFWVKVDGHLKKLTERVTTCQSLAGNSSFMSSEEAALAEPEHEPLPQPLKFVQDRVLHPSSMKRLVWDMIGLVFIVFDIAVIPLQFFYPLETEETRLLAWSARVFWSMDIPMGFLTGFLFQDGQSELRLGKIARRYARSWLGIDILIVLLDWVDIVLQGGGMGDVSAARMGKTMRILRMLRIVRLIRIAKMPMLAGTWLESYIRSEKVILVASMTKLMLFITVLMHFIACIWYGIGTIYGEEEGWLKVFDGRLPADQDLLYRYSTSFHWSLTQFTGTMEVYPATAGERMFAVMVLLMAFVVSATFISNITSAMTRLNMITGNEAAMFVALREYLNGKGFSRTLMIRVQRNARHLIMESRHNCPEKNVELLQLISEPLRMEIHFELHAPVLRIHPLFRHMEEMACASLRKICHTAVCTTFLSPGDTLFTDGEVKEPPEMYFITKGDMTYVHSVNGSSKIGVHTWIAEPVLWCMWQHRGLLKASSECELLVLNAQCYRAICHQNRNPHLNLGTYGIEYVDLINQDVLTDIDDSNHATDTIHKAFGSHDDLRASGRLGSGVQGVNLRNMLVRKANVWMPSMANNWRGSFRASHRTSQSAVHDISASAFPAAPGASCNGGAALSQVAQHNHRFLGF